MGTCPPNQDPEQGLGALRRLVGIRTLKSSLFVLLIAAACGIPDPETSPRATSPRPARFEIREGSQVSITRSSRDPQRFSTTFTVQNSGGVAGRPRCWVWVGTAKKRLPNLPMIQPGEERAPTRSVRVGRKVREIDGDVTCD